MAYPVRPRWRGESDHNDKWKRGDDNPGRTPEKAGGLHPGQPGRIPNKGYFPIAHA